MRGKAGGGARFAVEGRFQIAPETAPHGLTRACLGIEAAGPAEPLEPADPDGDVTDFVGEDASQEFGALPVLPSPPRHIARCCRLVREAEGGPYGSL